MRVFSLCFFALRILPDAEFRARSEGLCGNFNGCSADEVDNTDADAQQTFGEYCTLCFSHLLHIRLWLLMVVVDERPSPSTLHIQAACAIRSCESFLFDIVHLSYFSFFQ